MIWGAILFSLYIYVELCRQFESSWEVPIDADFPLDTLKTGLYVLCAVVFLLSIYFRNHLKKRQQQKDQQSHMTGHHPVVGQYIVAVIISIALSEAIGIVGLVLFFLTKDFKILYTLVGISALAMLYHRPKKSELEDLLHR